MNFCDQIESRSMALAALPASDAARAAAEGHATSCPRCAGALQDGARLLAMVEGELRPPRGSPPLARVEQAVLAEWDRPPPRLFGAVFGAAIFAAVCLTAQQLVHDAGSWVLAGAAASLAALLSALAPGRRSLLAIVGASLGLALAALFGAGSTGDAVGLSCLSVELSCAFVPLVFDALGLGRVVASVESRAALAGAAALSSQAALHLACPVRGAMLHLLVFHFAGVIAAAAIGARLQIRSRS